MGNHENEATHGDVEITMDKCHIEEEYSEQAHKQKFGYTSSLTGRDRGLLARILRPNDRVLDAGCGQGALFKTTNKMIGTGGTIIGIDLCKPMLLLSKKAMRDVECKIHLVLADVEKLPIKHSSLDAAICSLGLHRMNPFTGLGEMYRVLKPWRYMIVTLPHCHDEDYRDLEHIPPELIPEDFVVKAWGRGFPHSVWRQEQETWREFNEWCKKNKPGVYQRIKEGWAYGYDDLEDGFRKIKDGKITSKEFEFIVERWEKKIREKSSINWVWFPTFKGFTELLESFRKAKNALLVYASSTKNLDSLRGGSAFEICGRIHSRKARHVVIVGKPSWSQDEGTC